MAKEQIEIGEVVIGEGCPPLLIAEIGINHNGDLQIAKRLIDAAFACGWPCAKFQKREPSVCVPEDQKQRLVDTPWGQLSYLDYRYRVEFGQDDYSELDRYCRDKPIMWTASVWDQPSLEFLLGFDVPFIKIPSAKLTDHELLTSSASSGRPVILSTGMSTLDETDQAVEILERFTSGAYVLLHTNSAYPSPDEELDINVMRTLRKRYGCMIGYSGHEYDLEPSVLAAALGACVIERHVTLHHELWGSDQRASLEVHAMDLLRKRIQRVLQVMKTGEKKVTPSEIPIRKKLRGT